METQRSTESFPSWVWRHIRIGTCVKRTLMMSGLRQALCLSLNCMHRSSLLLTLSLPLSLSSSSSSSLSLSLSLSLRLSLSLSLSLSLLSLSLSLRLLLSLFLSHSNLNVLFWNLQLDFSHLSFIRFSWMCVLFLPFALKVDHSCSCHSKDSQEDLAECPRRGCLVQRRPSGWNCKEALWG